MDGTRRRFLAVLAGAALLLAACTGGGSGGTINNALVTTEYQTFDGSRTTLASLRGRPVVVNFFASWCAPCKVEMPDFEKVHKEYADRVLFVGIATQDSAAKVTDVVKQTGITYAIGLDPDGLLFTKSGGLGMPTTVVLTADGKVADTHTGALDASTLRAKLDKVLG
jgi:thiol-disulfide isomerase/thioredoxin